MAKREEAAEEVAMVALETECPACLGGTIGVVDPQCMTCGGKGYQKTEAGEALLRFLGRWRPQTLSRMVPYPYSAAPAEAAPKPPAPRPLIKPAGFKVGDRAILDNTVVSISDQEFVAADGGTWQYQINQDDTRWVPETDLTAMKAETADAPK